MRIPRLYVDQPLASGADCPLDRRALDHAVKVLRLRAGDPLCLFNGQGGEFSAVLARGGDGALLAQVGEFTPDRRESPLSVRLVQGISRGERMDYTLQKAVELGVTDIVPVVTERTVLRLAGERAERRLAHWRGVILAACEQSGRTRVPAVAEPRALSEYLAGHSADPVAGAGLLLDWAAPDALTDLGALTGPVSVLIGPEGGLAAAERQAALAAGYRPVRLGPRILRTETAAVVALAVLQALAGDLGGRQGGAGADR
ncbi:16S rRNA (uracil(1498)-N(3))-methyltransferase [Immundisolibacter sp.]|uniref:16S rRNA (uracil(1498)-N(3))-methyltransferase n=1 Tax=Immundisolibacter sp. TaxID=1934948 RepID=UPI002B071791|nr:16S rRNA (uracil(1498)-N(3))-methyltransferase [Immundisolibacter sp.]MEA3220538.1 Ribosomal RNA small subunit methyltransferase E [Immundisolibacter sp.]